MAGARRFGGPQALLPQECDELDCPAWPALLHSDPVCVFAGGYPSPLS